MVNQQELTTKINEYFMIATMFKIHWDKWHDQYFQARGTYDSKLHL